MTTAKTCTVCGGDPACPACTIAESRPWTFEKVRAAFEMKRAGCTTQSIASTLAISQARVDRLIG